MHKHFQKGNSRKTAKRVLLTSQVLKAGQQLRKLHFSDNTVQCQVNINKLIVLITNW